MRIFIAIDIPQDVKERIYDLQKRYYKKGYSLNKDIHITLRFLGELELNQVNDLISKLKEISFKKFRVDISGVGFFRRRGMITSVYLLIYSKEILNLKVCVDNFINLKYDKELPFKTHITLFRFKKLSMNDYNMEIDYKDSFFVGSFSLIESKMVNGFREYAILETFKLL